MLVRLYLTNGASVLQAELGDGQLDESVFIGLQPVPLNQQVKDVHRKAEMGVPGALVLEATNQGQHEKDRTRCTIVPYARPKFLGDRFLDSTDRQLSHESPGR